jgi:hypothetical protein
VVRNEGNEPVFVPTTTLVSFSGDGDRGAVTTPLVAGDSVEVRVPIPTGCFSPDCNFTIQLDNNGEVEELKHDAFDTSHEDNNIASGMCIG